MKPLGRERKNKLSNGRNARDSCCSVYEVTLPEFTVFLVTLYCSIKCGLRVTECLYDETKDSRLVFANKCHSVSRPLARIVFGQHVFRIPTSPSAILMLLIVVLENGSLKKQIVFFHVLNHPPSTKYKAILVHT